MLIIFYKLCRGGRVLGRGDGEVNVVVELGTGLELADAYFVEGRFVHGVRSINEYFIIN